jgi:hypothetical protein
MTFKLLALLKRACIRPPKDGQPLHPHDERARIRLAELALSRRSRKVREDVGGRVYSAAEPERMLSRGPVITAVRNRPRNAGMPKFRAA